jgi:hypothetical protein
MESAAFRRSIDGCGDRGVVMAHIRWRNQSGHMLVYEIMSAEDGALVGRSAWRAI